MTSEPTIPLDPPLAEAAVPTASVAPENPEGPRVRWAGIVWGAVFAALSVWALTVIGDAKAREAIRVGILDFDIATINPGTVWGGIVLVAGVVLLIIGGLALIRHAQRRTS